MNSFRQAPDSFPYLRGAPHYRLQSLRERLGMPALRPLSTKERASVAEFCRSMEEEVIPQIVEDVRERQRLAAEQRSAGVPLWRIPP